MERVVLQQRAAGLLRQFKIVAILGPRQAGKITLARQIAAATTDFSPERNFFDQEDSVHLERLADRPELPARFLIVGSASRNLLQPGSETRAGRIAFLEVTPFALGDTGTIEFEKLRVRGGFPLSFLAATDAGSVPWREFHIRTLLERDLPALGIQIPAGALRRFWMMLAVVTRRSSTLLIWAARWVWRTPRCAAIVLCSSARWWCDVYRRGSRTLASDR